MRRPPDFHQTYVFAWEEEPHDERLSEFKTSTGYSVLSGYHVPSDLNARAARRRQGSGFGFKGILAACAVLLVACSFAIYEAVKHLKA